MTGSKETPADPILAIATGNAHKVEEIFDVLAPLIPGLRRDQIVTQKQLGIPSPVEDAVSFEGNALIKAESLAQESGLPTLGDDSGLVVDVMGAAPGIFSARWAGQFGGEDANMSLLLDQLKDVPAPHRGASFVCVTALVTPSGTRHFARGTVEGSLRTSPRGEGGFGYDPIFTPAGWDKTLAEVSAAEKNRISHRARALQLLSPQIRKVLRGQLRLG